MGRVNEAAGTDDHHRDHGPALSGGHAHHIPILLVGADHHLALHDIFNAEDGVPHLGGLFKGLVHGGTLHLFLEFGHHLLGFAL